MEMEVPCWRIDDLLAEAKDLCQGINCEVTRDANRLVLWTENAVQQAVEFVYLDKDVWVISMECYLDGPSQTYLQRLYCAAQKHVTVHRTPIVFDDVFYETEYDGQFLRILDKDSGAQLRLKTVPIGCGWFYVPGNTYITCSGRDFDVWGLRSVIVQLYNYG